MTLPYWRNCVHAPADRAARHCNKLNIGDTSDKKAAARGKVNREKTGVVPRAVGKGNFGCCNRCRFFEPREEKK